MYKPIFLIAKNNAFEIKKYLDIVYDLNFEFVDNINMLNYKLKEYTAEEEIIPLVIIIGKYFHNQKNKNCETNKIISQLKKRPKTIVIIFSTDVPRKIDLENLVFDVDYEFFEILEELSKIEEFADLVSSKNINKIRQMLPNIINNIHTLKLTRF